LLGGTPYDQVYSTGALTPVNVNTPAGSPGSPLPRGEFSHLPNMFHSPRFNLTGGVWQHTDSTGANLLPSPNLFRLFEYVQVPSRFVGTETWFPPGVMQGNDQRFAPNSNLPVHQFHPPFNRVARHRDPGKVNVNTISDPFVWQGIIDDRWPIDYGTAPWRWLYQLISTSRYGALPLNATQVNTSLTSAFGTHPVTEDGNQLLGSLPGMTDSALPIDIHGYPRSIAALLSLNPNVPTLFAAPFRSYAGHTLVPLDTMRKEINTLGPAPSPIPVQPEREIDGTFLRTTSDNTATSGYYPAYPLLEYPGFGSTATWWENGGGGGAILAEDPYRNPYFAYRSIMRLDNLLTTRSNVYAIWLTVGYFEVTPAPSNDPQRSVKYPDGWVLGQELNSDTGDIQRHRSFYMYDRTIPVGFERGENHNAHRGILLERFIE
jgi:hypothetical protein